MLDLVTHEPHFSLLKEEIVFGKNVKKATNPESITFHLLHLSILREYLDHEFASLKVSQAIVLISFPAVFKYTILTQL